MVALKRVRTVGLMAALVAVLAIGSAVPAVADYGNSKGNVQLYQATASFNCNNADPTVCPPDPQTGLQFLGGFWAWAVFNADGTFDGEGTGCSHVVDVHEPGLQGAQHAHFEGHYIITTVPFAPGLWIVITDEVDTFTGGTFGTGTTMTVTNEFQPVGPAAKAKLSASDFLGFKAPPGVSMNVTVTPMRAAR